MSNTSTHAVVADTEVSDVAFRTVTVSDAALLPQNLVAYMATKLTTLCLALLVTYSILATFCIAMVVYLRRHRSGALRGDSAAARKLILPAFEPLLWLLGAATSAFSVYFASTLLVQSFPPEVPSIAAECVYGGRQFVLLLVIVFMLQKSVTVPALRRAVAITLVLSTYTIPVAWYCVTHSDPRHVTFNFGMLATAHLLVLPLFIYVIVRPPGRASKSALRLYCGFGITQNLLQLASNAAFYTLEVDVAFCILYVQLALCCVCPIFIWRVLQADTEHWRGLGQRACALQSLFRQRARANERVSSQGLHVLVEMHRKFILDFAYLELRQRIGVGASAVVYNGVLHNKTPVAIKVYTPRVVTEETVAAFSHEAALCGALKHPNIVTFYGMCVAPPTICLVSELCQLGSLDVVTQQLATRPHDARRQQFLVNLGYMLDTARAVAYLHSFSPAFVHRDIKPANFVVDADGTVKLTDFGESRSLPQVAKTSGDIRIGINDISIHDTDTKTGRTRGDDFPTTSNAHKTRERSSHHGRANGSSLSLSSSTAGDSSPPYVDFDCARPSDVRAATSTNPTSISNSNTNNNTNNTTLPSVEMTVKGTVDYMAPEMINGRGGVAAYGEAADVYSLAITMWDVLHPGVEKYPQSRRNPLRVFETVIAGRRPALDTSVLPPSLCELLAQSWHQDYWRRPTAQTIVRALERIQVDANAGFALELADALASTAATNNVNAPALLVRPDDVGLVPTTTTTTTMSGERVVECMKTTLHAVASVGEGVRLGNLLMDAGFVHHVKHARAFAYARDAFYYMDDSAIQHSQPFAMLEAVGESHNPSHVDDKHDEYQDGSGSNGYGPASAECECRRLGQRLASRKSNKRLFLRRHQAIPEDAVLTAALLANDTRPNGIGDFLHRTSDARANATSNSSSSSSTLSPMRTVM